MRRLILLSVATFIFMAISGCTHYKPEFNQAYLPNTVPGSPQKRIELPKLVIDKASVTGGGFFGKSTTYLPTSLYWVEEDNLLFNIMSEGNKSLLYSFLIIPSTSEVKLLEGAEKHALLDEIDKNTSFVSSESTGKQVLKGIATALIIALQVAAAAAGGSPGGSGGSGFSEDYQGKIENNGTALDLDISIKKARSGYRLKYVATNKRTENALRGETLLAVSNDDLKSNKNSVQDTARNWLKSWRVSPDGRYYVIGDSATFVDPEEEYGAFTNLIENYDREYAGFDINPRWDKIALLNIEEDEKTNQMNYWIEFYPFDYRNNNEVVSAETMAKKNHRANAGCCFLCLPSLHRGE